ncbi:MAG: hypothetical protein PHU85_12070, partial [Phycisphaerae bacterium]|nr:hypothetical protein [Phycisphaerae bacterium]
EQNGDKHLKVTNTDAKELFDGPVNTADERKKIPAEAIEIVKISRDMMVRIQMGRAGAGNVVNPGMPQVVDSPLDEILGGDRKAADEFSRRVGDYGVKVSVDSDGKHRLLITGKDNAVVFDGPTDTAEQWQKIKDVPADVLDAARKMDKNLAVEGGGAGKPPTSGPAGQ